jgi:hypothetical protein
LTWRFSSPRSHIADQIERSHYVTKLGDALSQSDWLCVSYTVMNSEIDILAVAGKSALADWSRRANSTFASWMSRRHGESGRLFADRPTVRLVERSSLAGWIAHLHNKPVRAGLVRQASESTWTSHRAYIGLEPTPSWLGVLCGLARSGMRDPQRLAQYVDSLPPPPFRIVKRRDRHAVPREPKLAPALPEGRLPPKPERLLQLASGTFYQPAELIASRRRIPALIRARSAVAQAGISLGLSGSELARVLGISQQAVSRLCTRHSSRADRDLLLAQLADEVTRVNSPISEG